jgi:hypothetical protein
MKVNVPGKSPLERLTNFTKSVIAVSKQEIEREEARWRKERRKRRPKK